MVLGGGNAKQRGALPPDARLGANANAFAGGFRLWDAAHGAPGTTTPVTGSGAPVSADGA